MARSLPKNRFLPSLLDRLTDDDPINNSIRIQKEKIQGIEKSLAELLQKPSASESEQSRQQRRQLQQQLDQVRAEYSVLTTSVSSLKEIRACVKRDLDWLLNASQYAPQEDLDGYPDVACSVLNYGMPDLTGKTVSGFDVRFMERLLKQVIVNFESRIIRNTLTVRVIADKTLFDHNALVFEIEGELWAEPQPLHLHLRTEFELESGNVSVYDYRPAELL
ncbi:type VI secretion system baseplate subunit TssE [Methylobacter sp.]|uniref:type VI secretion system baseplate subunit TssE n=1 Tax=Methylobacter sp. TaxID=2051955 RepID=UPI002FDCFDDE